MQLWWRCFWREQYQSKPKKYTCPCPWPNTTTTKTLKAKFYNHFKICPSQEIELRAFLPKQNDSAEIEAAILQLRQMVDSTKVRLKKIKIEVLSTPTWLSLSDTIFQFSISSILVCFWNATIRNQLPNGIYFEPL